MGNAPTAVNVARRATRRVGPVVGWRRRVVISLVAGAAAAAIPALAGARSGRGDPGDAVPGDARSGARVFAARGCSRCHGLPWGRARTVAPLGQARLPRTALDIAAAMWNHAPVMLRASEANASPAAPFTTREMADLYAFLAFVDVLEPKGDAARGRSLFTEKRCELCHRSDLVTAGTPIAPAVEYWSTHTDLNQLAQALWNHGGVVGARLAPPQLPWPVLDEGELADILAFVRSVNRIAPKRYPSWGDPARGGALYEQRGCRVCHAAMGRSGTPDASGGVPVRLVRTVTGLAAVLWNHYPLVAGRDRRPAGVKWPALAGDEMSHLIAYLVASAAFEDRGDPFTGKRLFDEKGCATCHRPGTDSTDMGALFNRQRGLASSVFAATVLWNHGRRMIAAMNRDGVPWPRVTGAQLGDLVAYVRAACARSIAAAPGAADSPCSSRAPEPRVVEGDPRGGLPPRRPLGCRGRDELDRRLARPALRGPSPASGGLGLPPLRPPCAPRAQRLPARAR